MTPNRAALNTQTWKGPFEKITFFPPDPLLVAVEMEDGGRGGDVVDGWFLFYGREEVWCLVHTRGCERRERTAVTRRFVYIPVLIMPWNQFLRDI